MTDAALTPAQEALLERVARHAGDDWRDRVATVVWREFDDGSPVLWVDGGELMFRLDGDRLHAVGPTPDADEVLCLVFAPDGTCEGVHREPNPHGPTQAEMN